MSEIIHVGVLALQGAYQEHVTLLQQASLAGGLQSITWKFSEVRTPAELTICDALIIPGGESTTMALVAARNELLEPLRSFVKIQRKPTWGTCAGLILLAEAANRTKRGGQDLIGGLDVRVTRNHFGRQTESFETDLDLPFLRHDNIATNSPFHAFFIRAPVVEDVIGSAVSIDESANTSSEIVVAPARTASGPAAARWTNCPVEVLARLPEHHQSRSLNEARRGNDIVAVRQGNVFGTSFHPELTQDSRIHVWWLSQVKEMTNTRQGEKVA